jgi:hypothetical protein
MVEANLFFENKMQLAWLFHSEVMFFPFSFIGYIICWNYQVESTQQSLLRISDAILFF